MPRRIKIGTRASRLALVQSSIVSELLTEALGDVTIELVKVISKGDRDRTTALSQMPEPGVFTRQLEADLFEGRFDLVVHSAKDLPSVMPEGLVTAAVPPRAPVEDALVANSGTTFAYLPEGAVIGTGSPRRAAQLLHVRPDLRIKEIRGNVETRLAKLDDGQYDALIMARAGLTRLGLTERIADLFDLSTFLPAGGQGFLLVQARADNGIILRDAALIDDPEARVCLAVERNLLSELNAGCAAAVGCHARFENDRLLLDAVVLDKSGKTRLHAFAEAESGQTEQNLARQVAADLIEQGARELMER
ncbi:MAG TPA: hydroxymethylbilane synthase [candidate division Zixibacteria bacterium]|nr:hydroxymethylbilane synthase [candidate division Zixibacteria bacterium]